MATWKDVESAEPEFAARVRALFDAHKHQTIATLRADGSPRISGIEVQFTDGELTFGSMPGARKGRDLHRDPRFALHSASVDPPEGGAGWPGDAKVAGRAVHAVVSGEGAPDGELFRADLAEVVLTGLNAEATMLVIESWTPGRGLRRVERE
ncbi:pyridoxamine 5'-phosphate oxidase family protein [Pseudonocardia sp.]|uniref:pyridoxamine 5'-phosphate oxidase family protein n=1 Tax=Pseudonocardia sp. TaxID=60912 RepID=UPI00260C732E|nr:pyridoxamine 5'-phosphate oxidase family protein [Pseudonocardia sp.]